MKARSFLSSTLLIVNSVMLAVMSLAVLSAGQTPPAGHSADWDAGWTAAYNADHPQPVAPKPVVTPTPTPATAPAINVRVIQPAENFEAVIDAAPPGKTISNYQLVAGQSYKAPGNWSPRNGNFDLDCQGATITLTEPAGASSGMRTTKPNCAIHDGKWQFSTVGNFTLFRLQADGCAITANTLIGPTIATFAMADTGGHDATISGNTIPLVNSVPIWITADGATVSGNTIKGSWGETQGWRVDDDAVKHAPSNVTVTGNTVGSVPAGNAGEAKGSREWRYCGSGCTDAKNTAANYARIGQDGMATAVQSIGQLAFDGNIFTGCGSVPQNLMVKNGNVTVTNTKFSGPPGSKLVSLSGPASVTFGIGNTLPTGAALYNPALKAANVTVSGP